MNENDMTREELVAALRETKKKVADLERLAEDRRRARDEASRAEAYFESCLNSIPDVVILLDDKGRFSFVNDAFLKLSDGRISSPIGKTFKEMAPVEMPDEIRELVSARIRRRLKKGESDKHKEIAVPGPDGNLITMLYSAMALRDEKGKVMGIIVIAHDISDTKKAEEDLRDSEEKFRMISEQSLMGITIIQDDRVVYVNEQAASLTGHTKDEVLAWEPVQFLSPVHSEDLPGVLEAFQHWSPSTSRNRALHLTYRIYGLDKEIKWVDQYSKTITFMGKPAILNILLDISKRKRLEEMMIQSEKMLSVGGLAAGMAHEINNPLAGILQGAQVIQNRISNDRKQNRDTAAEYGTSIETIGNYLEARGVNGLLDGVIQSGRQAAEIVSNMLSFSRKSDSSLSNHDLGELLDKTVDLISNDYDIKNRYDFRSIKIIREYDVDVPLVRCDPTKIQQVFLNILKNGVQALEGQQDESRDPCFILRISQNKDNVRIEIEDNGPGMTEETRKRIFEPFFTTKAVGEGTGLGLSISYFIIQENHDGAMTVESDVDRGTKFIIQLPLTRQGSSQDA